MTRSLTRSACIAAVFWMGIMADIVSAAASETPVPFWTPSRPPRASYRIDAALTMADQIVLQGKETIHFANTTSAPLQTLAVTWSKVGQQTLTIVADGQPVALPKSSGSFPQDFALAQPLAPGQALTLEVEFRVSTPAPPQKPEEISTDAWYPQLWWGCGSHNDYEVRLTVPPEYVLATSGRLDPKTGAYRVEKAPSFGIWLRPNCEVLEAQAGDVPIRCLYQAADKQCAQLLLDTAVDVIGFYRARFGFYPYPALTIVPGADEPMGGYPLGTSIIVIHGMGRMKDKPEAHWRWITAHEIGHQYWGRYVLEKDDPGWLWIGLGIYTDRAYCRARHLSDENHRQLLARYVDGVRKGLDTTVSRSQEGKAQVKFDFNNVVIHGKGFAIISALDRTLGQPVFERICQRCLREFAGRPMGMADFRSVCEQESSQDLGWFFEQWVNSNKYLSCEIAAQKCEPRGDGFVTEVEVRYLGTLRMPVPIVASFEDGTTQSAFTSRLHAPDTVRFQSRSALKQVRLDPEGALAQIVPPPSPDAPALAAALGDLPWTGAGDKALEVFQKVRASEFPDSGQWFKLGMALYDGKHYPEALEAFTKVEALAKDDRLSIFAALVWQGHLLDLLAQRDQAVARYQKALEHDPGRTMRHDQYKMAINREWVEKRLHEPFRRE